MRLIKSPSSNDAVTVISKTYAMGCNFHRAQEAEPPPTCDVNRDSGTDRANGGWLRLLVRPQLVNNHKLPQHAHRDSAKWRQRFPLLCDSQTQKSNKSVRQPYLSARENPSDRRLKQPPR